jgi:hypothetical protein
VHPQSKNRLLTQLRNALLLLGCGTIAIYSLGANPVGKAKTFGTMGKEQRVLRPGQEAELYRYSGKGCLTHMWFGGNFKNYGLTHIRVYVDRESPPAIDMELAMGHGIGFQDDSAPWGVERIGKTGDPSGIYNTYRIPFEKSIRVTALRANGEEPGTPPFWWIIRGTENLPIDLGGVRLPGKARLRLYKVENRLTRPLEEIDIYNGQRSGALYQVTIAASSTSFSFLESCVSAYIGGAQTPLVLSSGLEDYFLGTYYFNRGKYYTPVAGLTHLVRGKEFSAYRFHETDPIFFTKGLRLTVRAGEKIEGQLFGNSAGPAETVFTTYVWVYEW